MASFAGRRQPYTQIGIRRVPCRRCGAPSFHQWQVCANGNRWLGVCEPCDLELNRLALEFMRVPNAEALLAAYADAERSEVTETGGEVRPGMNP